MSIAAALVLAAASASQGGTDTAPEATSRGTQVAVARIEARILRPAVVRDGELQRASQDMPRAQRVEGETRVTYEFE